MNVVVKSKKIKDFIKKILLHEEVAEVQSMQSLSNIINVGIYLPITTSSLKIKSLQFVFNEIIINQRESLIELGAGISTIAIARLIKLNRLPAHLITIEENEDWLDIVKLTLIKEDLIDAVTLIHAPLNNNNNLSLNNTDWYSISILDEKLSQKTFDLVLVDAPSAWKPEIQLSRYPALPYLNSKLQENFSFFLDDVNRPGEQKIIKLWEKQFNLKFTYLSSSFAYATKGKVFNID